MSESVERTPAPPGYAAPAAARPGIAHVQGTRRQRRPTGTPPPLPHPIAVSTTAWVLLAVAIVAFAFVFSEITPWRRSGDQASTWVLLRLADVRTPWLTDVANGINAAGSGWGTTVLGVSVVVLIMIFRRWRHLAVFLGSLFFLEVVAGILLGTSCALLAAVVVDGLQRRWQTRRAAEVRGPAGADVPDPARRAGRP